MVRGGARAGARLPRPFRRLRGLFHLCLIVLAMQTPSSPSHARPQHVPRGAPEIAGAALEPVPFSSLPGWPADDHAAAFAAFRLTCATAVSGEGSLRQGVAPSAALAAVCEAALGMPEGTPAIEARTFFERHFQPHRVRPHDGQGFLTGYFEPEFSGALSPTALHDTPLLARPSDLVTLVEGDAVPGLDPALRGARRILTADGVRFEPYADRAAIEDGALGDDARALVYLERVDAFMAHVQGSVRVRLSPGQGTGQVEETVRRYAYAGRNGHAYTGIARLLVTERGFAPADLTAPRLVAWLRDNPEEARLLMRRNRSYIFFREADELLPGHGPLGGASVQLMPGRSLAIDRAIWPYGLPFWIDANLPAAQGEAARAWQRLMIAQDTGSAIVGPARADIFFGSGAAAGAQAGIVRHAPENFVVLLPVSPERGT